MTRRSIWSALLVLAVATVAQAGEIVLPGFAWQLPGKGLNRWTSEVYATNPGTTPVAFRYTRALVGRLKTGGACLPYSRSYDVPPQTTVVVTAENLATDLGCVVEFVGGLVMVADGTLVMGSRMTNVFTPVPPPDGATLLNGFGQEIPGVALEELPRPGSTWILPALIAHPDACGAPRFESYMHFADPTEKPVEVTFAAGSLGRPGRLVVNGAEVSTPHTVSIKPSEWRQFLVALPNSALTACGEPVAFDLVFSTTSPVAVYAAVVDRTTQDPRTVMPTQLTR